MRFKNYYILVLTFVLTATNSFAQNTQAEVLKVVNDFFLTMEKKDSVGFNNLFLEDAYAYSTRQTGDSTITRSSVLKARFSKDQLKERLRPEEITIHVNDNLAAVWAPYDFWVNDELSHCGYEVFTLIKNNSEWKIASLTYSVEMEACKE